MEHPKDWEYPKGIPGEAGKEYIPSLLSYIAQDIGQGTALHSKQGTREGCIILLVPSSIGLESVRDVATHKPFWIRSFMIRPSGFEFESISLPGWTGVIFRPSQLKGGVW